VATPVTTHQQQMGNMSTVAVAIALGVVLHIMAWVPNRLI